MAKLATVPRRTFIQRSRGVSPELKALYHAELGAGRKRVVRDFFDLSPIDIDAIVDRLQRALDQRIARGGT